MTNAEYYWLRMATHYLKVPKTLNEVLEITEKLSFEESRKVPLNEYATYLIHIFRALYQMGLVTRTGLEMGNDPWDELEGSPSLYELVLTEEGARQAAVVLAFEKLGDSFDFSDEEIDQIEDEMDVEWDEEEEKS